MRFFDVELSPEHEEKLKQIARDMANHINSSDAFQRIVDLFTITEVTSSTSSRKGNIIDEKDLSNKVE